MSSISVIMPCYNRGYDLMRVLRSYDAQVGPDSFELIAIDDASLDNTYPVLSSYRPERFELKIARMEKNSGPAAARNRALEMAQYPLVLFVGDDILPEPDFIRGHIAAHNRYPGENEAILGRLAWPSDLPVNTLMAHIDGKGAEQFSYYYLQHDQIYDYRHFYTSNISLKRSRLLSEGKYFDTDFVHAAFEDAELSYRLAQRGLTIRYQKQILAYHYHYHTIWSFSSRQYKAGLMACQMIAKHPELSRQMRGLLFPARVVRLLLEQWRYPSSHKGWESDPDHLEQMALHIASCYEWRNNPFLEVYYLGILRYFFQKGLFHGLLVNQTAIGRAVGTAYARRMLFPVMKRFWEQSRDLEDRQIEWPQGWQFANL